MAMRAAVEERGVAVVVIPGEIFLQRADESGWTARPVVADPLGGATRRRVAASGRRQSSTAPTPSPSSAARVSKERMTRLVAAAATLNAPIVHALRGKEFIEYDNPFDVGMTGLLGFASGYKAIKEADALLMLGTDFPYQQFYPDSAKVIQVDIRGRNLGRRTPIELGLVGTVRDTLAALQPLLAAEEATRPSGPLAATTTARPASTLDALAVNDRDRQPDPSGIRCRTGESAGARRRGVHRRRRIAGGVGGPVPEHERQAQAGRIVQPRHHGLRAAACDRRPDRVPRPPSGRPRRRRRADHALRRADHVDPEPACRSR